MNTFDVAARALAAAVLSAVMFAWCGLCGLGGLPTAAAQAGGSPPEPTTETTDGRVLVVTLPRVTWSEIADVAPKHLMEFFEQAAVAQCSVRTAGSNTRPGDAYLTIGAGNRMGTLPDVDGEVVDRGEALLDGDPTALFTRLSGVAPTAPIIATGKPSLDRFNEDLHFSGRAGALATALASEDRSMAVIANADKVFDNPRHRHAALAAMDDTGQVWAGMVDGRLLRTNDAAAYGIETDTELAATVTKAALNEHDVVLLEMSDLERADAARATATVEQGQRQFRRALRSADRLFGSVMESIDVRRDTVIVVAPTAPLEQVQLTVFAMAGPEIEPGWARSSTTRRDGYVTLTDLAPSIVSSFGIDVPSSMTDTRLSAVANETSLENRMDTMIDWSRRSIARDTAFGPTTVIYIVVILIVICLAMLCLAKMSRLARAVRGLALVVLAVPPVSFLVGLTPASSASSISLTLVLGAVVAATLASLTRRFDPSAPPLVLVGLLWVVLAVDIATGGHLQINTIFGYSPIVAGRFAGFGNQAFSMIAISSLLLASALVDRREPQGASIGNATLVAVLGWFAVTLVLDGHPAMGSDVGGVLAFVPAVTISILMFRGIRVNAKMVAGIVVGTVVVLALFAGLDLQRPPAGRTHLGRFVAQIADGGAGIVLERKIAANLRVLTSVWAWVIPLALVYFAYLTWRPNRTLEHLHRRYPRFRVFGVAALTLGVLAMALNDSGVSLPAIMLAIVLAYVSYLVIDLELGSS